MEQMTVQNSAVYAEEALVVDVQSFLYRMMHEKGMSRSELAEAMGVTKARVTQIFSDECKNFTVKLLARAVHAMGEQIEVSSSFCRKLDDAESANERRALIAAAENVSTLWKNVNEAEELRSEQEGIFECPPGNERLTAALGSISRHTRHAEMAIG